MAHRDEIVAYADELLEVHRFPEYGRPGLQVLGADEVTKIACGVSASRELFERAAATGAQLLIVHHGMFWRNEPLWIDRRQRGRLEALFAADLTLLAYHLALDAHPTLGNNALLADALGVDGRAARSRRSARAVACASPPASTRSSLASARRSAGASRSSSRTARSGSSVSRSARAARGAS